VTAFTSLIPPETLNLNYQQRCGEFGPKRGPRKAMAPSWSSSLYHGDPKTSHRDKGGALTSGTAGFRATSVSGNLGGLRPDQGTALTSCQRRSWDEAYKDSSVSSKGQSAQHRHLYPREEITCTKITAVIALLLKYENNRLQRPDLSVGRQCS
jgi:hypothetical protein